MMRERFFTGRQVVTIVVAICLTIVLMPTAVWAAANSSLVRITDGKGKVAQVDKKGRLVVTDGSGPMTVDGKVAIKGSVAVAGTISDPSVPSRKAHVDSSGRLTTVGATSAIDSAGLVSVTDGDNFVTSPTTASLNITKISFSNPSANSTATYAEVRFYFYKVGVDTGGNCTPAKSTLLGMYNIAPGDDVEDTFPAPLLVKPTGSAKYCLDLYTQTLNGVYTANWLPSYSLAAYVSSGTYTGTGAHAAATTPAAITKRERATTHR